MPMDARTLEAINVRNGAFLEWIGEGNHWLDFSDPEAAADRQQLLFLVNDLERHHADDRSTQELVTAVSDFFDVVVPVIQGGSMKPDLYDASFRGLIVALGLFGVKVDEDRGKIER